MKRPSRGRAARKRPASPADAGGPGSPGPRRRDLRIDATPEQLAAVIGAGPRRPRTSGTISGPSQCNLRASPSPSDAPSPAEHGLGKKRIIPFFYPERSAPGPAGGVAGAGTRRSARG